MKEKDQQKWMNLAWILKGVKAAAEEENKEGWRSGERQNMEQG